MKNLIKAISLLLLACVIWALVSCKEQEDSPDYNEDQHIDIDTDEVKYDSEFIESAASRYSAIMTTLAEGSINVKLNEQQKQSFIKDFKETLIPIFYRIKIYEKELDAILDSSEDYLNSSPESVNAGTVFAFYELFISQIGQRRSGLVIYELSKHFTELKANDYYEKYDEFGYSWYLADAERCTSLGTKLRELGEEKFIYAISVSSAITSLLFGEDKPDGDGRFELTDAEFLFILDSQGQHFSSRSLSTDEWQIFGALITEIVPTNVNDPFSSLLYALKNEDYYTSVFQAMPEIIALYSSVASALKTEGTFSLSLDSDLRAKSLASALIKSEEKIKRLNTALTSYAKTDSKRIKDAVLAYSSTDDAESFFNAHKPIECNMLIAKLEEVMLISDGTAYTVFENSLKSYFCGIAPYIIYALSN